MDSGFTESYGGTPYLYELWQDPLPDMTQYNAGAGDVFDVTATLDRSHTIPASTPGTIFSIAVDFWGYSYPDVYGSSSTTASFFNAGSLVFATTAPTYSSSSGGTLAASVMFDAPNDTSLTFDQVRFHCTVTDTQGSVLNLRLAELSITRMIPVPEPGCSLTLAAGLTGLVLARWKRKKE